MAGRIRKRSKDEAAKPRTPEEIRAQTFQRAAKLLAAKPRSVAELRERLLERRGVSGTLVDEVIGRLKEYGYLDDQRFAVTYGSLRVKQRPTGRRRLQQDLKLKKVPNEVADQALDAIYAETSEEDLIDQAIEKRLRLRGRPKDRKDTKSLFDHLLRLGFPFELVSDKVRRIARSDLDE
ncbi:MAG TPA: regulatory protein RecX [Pyrinomonadaceae bacterium]|nr:regulatory protein RecX [Pyrinomonadaceae bacterium]